MEKSQTFWLSFFINYIYIYVYVYVWYNLFVFECKTVKAQIKKNAIRE